MTLTSVRFILIVDTRFFGVGVDKFLGWGAAMPTSPIGSEVGIYSLGWIVASGLVDPRVTGLGGSLRLSGRATRSAHHR